MKLLFVLNYQDCLVYDEQDFLIDAYRWPFGQSIKDEHVNAMGAMIDAQHPSLVKIDLNLFDIHMHHRSLWNNPLVGHA